MKKVFYFTLALIGFSKSSEAQDSGIDSVFLRWKSDTLKLISKQLPQEREKYLRYYYKDSSVIFTELHLNNDEEFVEMVNHFNCRIRIDGINKIRSISISRVLDLLKENKELPKEDFVLSFKNVKTFYASEIPGQTYSFVEDIKDITVETDGSSKLFKYEYNKGSLSSKTEICTHLKKLNNR